MLKQEPRRAFVQALLARYFQSIFQDTPGRTAQRVVLPASLQNLPTRSATQNDLNMAKLKKDGSLTRRAVRALQTIPNQRPSVPNIAPAMKHDPQQHPANVYCGQCAQSIAPARG